MQWWGAALGRVGAGEGPKGHTTIGDVATWDPWEEHAVPRVDACQAATPSRAGKVARGPPPLWTSFAHLTSLRTCQQRVREARSPVPGTEAQGNLVRLNEPCRARFTRLQPSWREVAGWAERNALLREIPAPGCNSREARRTQFAPHCARTARSPLRARDALPVSKCRRKRSCRARGAGLAPFFSFGAAARGRKRPRSAELRERNLLDN